MNKVLSITQFLVSLLSCTAGSLLASYTTPARLEEVAKELRPADDEKSGDEINKAQDKQSRYEQAERQIKKLDEKAAAIERAEYPTKPPLYLE